MLMLQNTVAAFGHRELLRCVGKEFREITVVSTIGFAGIGVLWMASTIRLAPDGCDRDVLCPQLPIAEGASATAGGGARVASMGWQIVVPRATSG